MLVRTLCRALVLGTLLASFPVCANPFYIARYDGLRSDATYTGAYALYYNPAALAGTGWDIAVDGTLVQRNASFTRDAAANHVPPELVGVNSGRATVEGTSVVPSIMARYGRRVGPVDLGFGIGVFVDVAGSAHYDKNEAAPSKYPGGIDGPQRFSGISTSFTSYSVALAFAVRDRRHGFSVGITPVLDVVRFATTVAANLDGTDDVVDASGALKEGRAYFHGGTVAGRFILGARLDRERWALGLTWHRGVTYHVGGTLDAALGTSTPTSDGATLSLPIADDLQFAAAIAVHRRIRLRPSIEWAMWHVLHANTFTSTSSNAVLLSAVRDFHDSVAGRVRADFIVHPRIQLQGGVGFEWGATPARTQQPGLGENNNLEVGAGVLAAVSHHVDVSLGVIWQYFLPRTVTDSISKPTENGRYTDSREFVSLHLEVHSWRPYYLAR
ncbi:MAG: outer membrane protein transport protein [Polyangia bacterium]